MKKKPYCKACFNEKFEVETKKVVPHTCDKAVPKPQALMPPAKEITTINTEAYPGQMPVLIARKKGTIKITIVSGAKLKVEILCYSTLTGEEYEQMSSEHRRDYFSKEGFIYEGNKVLTLNQVIESLKKTFFDLANIELTVTRVFWR